MLNRKQIYYSLLVTILGIDLFFTSCSHNKASDAAIVLSCKKFSGQRLLEVTTGRRDSFRYKMNSFFEGKNELPVECVLTKYETIARYYSDVPIYDSVDLYLDSAIVLFDKFGNDRRYIDNFISIFNFKGLNLYSQDKYTQAYDYYYRAKVISRKSGDTCLLHSNDYVLAIILYKQKNFRRAIEYFRNTNYYGHKCLQWNGFDFQQNVDNIALCYEKMGLYDSALYYFDSAISIINEFGKYQFPITVNKAIGVVLGNKGTVLLEKGKIDSAIILLSLSHEINIRQHHENNDALLTLFKLAGAYAEKNDQENFFQALTIIRKELDTVYHTPDEEARWLRMMAEYQNHIGNEEQANVYYRKYVAIRDSVIESERKNLQTDIGKEVETKERAYQLGLLQKQSKLNNLYLTIAVLFLCMSIVIVLLIYRNYKRSRKNILVLTNLNNQVFDQKIELEKKNKEKDRILHIVAHDLRNPISGIMAICERMSESEESEQASRSLSLIRRTSSNALTLINELLELNSIQDETDVTEVVFLDELVPEAISLLRAKSEEKQLIMEFLGGNEVLPVNAPSEKIARVFGNLLSNAIKFTPEGRQIFVAIEKINDVARVTIKDNGIGIPEDLQAHIFETFTKAKRTGTAGEKPFGLGLSICKQIVDANNGKLWFESREGEGTTFFVEFPVIK